MVSQLQEAEKLTEEQAQEILRTNNKVVVAHNLGVTGRLIGKSKHLKGVTFFLFKPLDDTLNEVFLPARDISLKKREGGKNGDNISYRQGRSRGFGGNWGIR